ncbi:hypothetical protein ASZ90_019767 [hydrocarbon metagenome]|uniref:Damage-control phosphatase ARMT1-like metal-binding domain-containing protein n=1 Tax=hydrocarbon metagenome TaxID=938273 RepID=A0A0W8E2I4_9ZZZZ
MKTYYDCIPCLLRQTVGAMRMSGADDGIQEKLIRFVLRETADMDLNETPPYMAALIHRQIREVLDDPDPYAEVKQQFNTLALDLYEKLQQQIKSAADPFETAVRISIAGNIIDFGVRADIGPQDVDETILECLHSPIAFNTASELSHSIQQADNILFLGDNAGEIVFDRLLIEQMPGEKVCYVVKAMPVINDATMEDAVSTGMTERVRVIDNGSDAPGTILKLCSPQFIQEFYKADLVIAKGQANYETLSEVDNK